MSLPSQEWSALEITPQKQDLLVKKYAYGSAFLVIFTESNDGFYTIIITVWDICKICIFQVW